MRFFTKPHIALDKLRTLWSSYVHVYVVDWKSDLTGIIHYICSENGCTITWTTMAQRIFAGQAVELS